ncbi:MAG: hypothetical protein NTX33_08795 [Propionibacteriales bacterium]|nr:hypothetical protein [Propionibacteriales bacterium]
MGERLRTLPPAVAAVAAGVLVLALVLALVLVDRDHPGARWYAFWERGDDTDAVLAVAREEASNFFDLDHRRIDADVEQVLSLATGGFAKEYREQKVALVAAVKEKKVVWRPTLPADGTALEYLDGDEAGVLLAVDVKKSSGDSPAQLERARARVVLNRVDGVWLVSDFQDVG